MRWAKVGVCVCVSISLSLSLYVCVCVCGSGEAYLELGDSRDDLRVLLSVVANEAQKAEGAGLRSVVLLAGHIERRYVPEEQGRVRQRTRSPSQRGM